jgi:ppGpp synthetase/RelA/SpoT-type nucleotidyltranferase
MARGPSHNIGVPAKASEVHSFLSGCRGRFIQDLGKVRTILKEIRSTDPSLRCIYKVYSRGDPQGGEELKNSRKVRLKFDEFNIKAGKTSASLYDVPDIIGLTVVVSYPSDINLVAAALDRVIEEKRLISVLSATPVSAGSKSALIISRFGRPIESKGYFACHYNVRTQGTGPRPICEVQIKTILHDAWGAKTHDLTYKPSGRTDQELRNSFDLLGDMLANLDQQSDALRRSIERTATIREKKRRAVRVSTLMVPVTASIQDLANASLKGRFSRLYNKIIVMGPGTSQQEASAALSKLLSLFETSPRVTSLMLCLLAVMVDRREFFEHAQDAIEAWEDSESDALTKLRVRCLGALAAFSAGDASEAIDIGEEILPEVVNAVGVASQPQEKIRALRLATSLYSSLAYYHADRIGSHEGEKRDSRGKCLGFLGAGLGLCRQLGLPADGLASDRAALATALEDSELGPSAFEAYDNEAFVRIQTAATETELHDARALLHFVHEKSESNNDGRAKPLFEYHDYCARMRLAELEALPA